MQVLFRLRQCSGLAYRLLWLSSSLCLCLWGRSVLGQELLVERPFFGEDILAPSGDTLLLRSSRTESSPDRFGELMLKVRDPECEFFVQIGIGGNEDGLIEVDPPAPTTPVKEYGFSMGLTQPGVDETIARGVAVTTDGVGGPGAGCTTGRMIYQLTFGVLPPGDSDAQLPHAAQVADPVNSRTGELFLPEPPDLFLAGPMALHFSRYYASALARETNIAGRLGRNWLHNYEWFAYGFSFAPGGPGSGLEVVNHQGRIFHFAETPTGFELEGDHDIPYQLIPDGDQLIFLDPINHRRYVFSNTTGSLDVIEDDAGNTLSFSYDQGLLSQVEDGRGRSLSYTYDNEFRLIEVSDGLRSIALAYTDNLLSSVTDARGNTTTYSYDATQPGAALLTEKTFPRGNAAYRQSFDSIARVVSQTDAPGGVVSLSYGDQATTITRADGVQERHDYDQRLRLTAQTDEAGNLRTFEYSGARRSAVEEDSGSRTSYTYHEESGKLASIFHADGGVTRYDYSARTSGSGTMYDLTQVTYPDDTTETYSYDGQGNMISRTDRAAELWQFSYDGQGQMLSAITPTGAVTTFTYNSDGTLAAHSDPAGNTQTYQYDALRRIVGVTTPDGGSRQLAYDDADNLVSVIDENGNASTFSYDSNNKLTSIIDPLSNQITYTYDGLDRAISSVDRVGVMRSRSYNLRGGSASMDDGDGVTIRREEPGGASTVSMSDGSGHSWQTQFDGDNIATSVTTPLAATMQFDRDAMGRITRLTTPLGRSAQVLYDAMGRAISVDNDLGETVALSYDAVGMLSGVDLLDAGIATRVERNADGFVTAITDPGGNVWGTARNSLGKVTGESDPLGITTLLSYDNRNRASLVTYPGGLGTLSISYDATGNLTQRRYSDGTEFNYGYNPLNRLISADGLAVSYDAAERVIESNGLTITRTPGGRIASINYAPGKTVTYSYNQRGLLQDVTDWNGAVTTFVYDAAQRLLRIERPNALDTVYSYDADDRLTEIQEGVISTIQLTYDAKSQLIAAQRDTPGQPAGPDSSVAVYSFDAASQNTAFSWDPLGRLTDDGNRSYEWNLASRLLGYRDAGNEVAMSYDALGLRLSRREQGDTTEYVWNYALDTASVQVERKNGVDHRYYVMTPAGNLLYSLDTQGKRLDYHFDEAGNTVFLSNELGEVAESYAYGPYGEPLGTPPAGDNPFTWNGASGAIDEGNGLYYFRARYYDSRSGRFLSRDPIRSFNPLAANVYGFAAGNPLMYGDPLGLSVEQKPLPIQDSGSPATARPQERIEYAPDVEQVLVRINDISARYKGTGDIAGVARQLWELNQWYIKEYGVPWFSWTTHHRALNNVNNRFGANTTWQLARQMSCYEFVHFCGWIASDRPVRSRADGDSPYWGFRDNDINAINGREIFGGARYSIPAGMVVTGSLPFGWADNNGGYHHVVISLGNGQNIGLGGGGLVLANNSDTFAYYSTVVEGNYYNDIGRQGEGHALPNPPSRSERSWIGDPR